MTAESGPTLREDLQGLFDAYATAYMAGDAAGCAAVFAPDGRLYSPWAPPALGRPAIMALHRDWVGGTGTKTMTVEDAGASGDLAWCRVTFSEDSVTGNGTTLAVLERAEGQGCLIRICSLNSMDQVAG